MFLGGRLGGGGIILRSKSSSEVELELSSEMGARVLLVGIGLLVCAEWL